MSVTLQQICKIYQNMQLDTLHRVSKDLWSISANFAENCKKYTGENFDNYSENEQDDFRKDAAWFQSQYKKCLSGDKSFWLCETVEAELMFSIDRLLSGVHTTGGNVREFISNAPDDLLDLIFNWDGFGSLYQFVMEQ